MRFRCFPIKKQNVGFSFAFPVRFLVKPSHVPFIFENGKAKTDYLVPMGFSAMKAVQRKKALANICTRIYIFSAVLV